MNMLKPSYLATVSIVAGLGGMALVSPALATDITVGISSTACPNPNFATIQAAVTAAGAGDHIKVCPGLYVEQVTIVQNNLTLESQKPLQAVIQAPPLMSTPNAIVLVACAANVKIRQFTIQGPGGGGCDSLEYGVRVDSGGSATIEKNRIAHIRDNPFSGCQNGNAVQIGRAAESTIGSGTVKDNQIDDYQKTGVVVSNAGSDADVENNTVQGVGPTSAIAQNGIQISGGATARVRNNDVSDNMYTPLTVVSTGILLFTPGVSTVEGNKVSDNDVDIYLFDSSVAVSIKNNEMSGGTFDGIDLVSSSGATLEGNKAHDNTFDGIYVTDTGSGNTLKNNDVSSNEEDGINLDGALNNLLDGNKAIGNSRYGIHAGKDFTAVDSTGNTIKNNQAKSNIAFDCKDESVGTGTAGTGNTWLNDEGVTSSPAGICKK
jgi:parallel beta-helix repeat protein